MVENAEQDVSKAVDEEVPAHSRPKKISKLGGLVTEYSWKDVTPRATGKIKNQGKTCASSYAFAVVAAVEAAQAIQNGQLYNHLSEQQVVDCTFGHEYLNFGCLGGHLENTLNYTKNNLIVDSFAYPYKGETQFCKDLKNTPNQQKNHSFSISGYQKIQSSSPKALNDALATAPVIAGVRAGSLIFRNYKAGIIESENCSSKFKTHDKADHAVLVIGYGETMLGQGYFIIKNSFGNKWGESGYAKISSNNL